MWAAKQLLYQVFRFQRRCYSDRGRSRRDYSDPGFQKLGYIHEGCFTYTHKSRLDRHQHGGQMALPESSCLDVATNVIIKRRDYLRRKIKLGDARRQFEEQQLATGNRSVWLETSSDEEEADEVDVNTIQEPNLPWLEFKPVRPRKGKRDPLSRKRGFRGMTQDFTKYTFPRSRIDEFTRKLAAKKAKR